MPEAATAQTMHTPGPWAVSDKCVLTSIDWGQEISTPVTVRKICDCENNRHYVSDQEANANARLIAASPDLLKAAQIVLAGLNARIDAAPGNSVPVFDGIAELSDAINKATIQSTIHHP